MRKAWWEDALFYCLDVETFADGDGDGVGDFVGLVDRLDHLVDLGVDAIWLLPIFPSPNRDDGYDPVDHCAVDTRLGTLQLFRAFVGEAHERGLRVVLDLPLNHTSDQHPWFRAARRHVTSRYGRYYVWFERPLGEPRSTAFPDEVPRPWSFDEVAGHWYMHHFYPFQPDLDVSNPDVWARIREIVSFWLDQGIDGVRIDAAPFLVEHVQLQGAWESHSLLRDLRVHVESVRPGSVLIGEANVPTDEQPAYFGDGDELQLLFDYTLNAGLLLALATERAWPLRRALQRTPARPGRSQWLSFLRLHDELSLERLGDEERDAVFERWSDDPSDRLYGRGLRRRLPAMLPDPAQLRLALSLLFSLPGSPCLLWGEEIGMGDNRQLPGRLAARTPMQWTGEPSAGFSDASPDQFVRPLVDQEQFAPPACNVADQNQDPESLLSFVRRVIRLRRAMPELAEQCEVPDNVPEPIFLHLGGNDRRLFVAIHNLSGEPVGFDAGDWVGPRLRDLFTGQPLDGHHILEPYGLRWLGHEPLAG